MQKQSEQKLDGFNFFNKASHVIDNVQHKSYKKLIVLAVLTGLTISGSYTLIIGLTHAVTQWGKNHQSTSEAKNQTYINEVKKIDDAHFKAFMAYMAASETLYDSRITIIENASAQARLINSDTYSAHDAAENMFDGNTKFKKQIQNEINSIAIIYEKIKNNQTHDIDEDDFEKFFYYYHLYSGNSMLVNKSLENTLNEYLYPDHKHNLEYNVQNGVAQNFAKAKEEREASIRALIIH
jgi:hypothetical protein